MIYVLIPVFNRIELTKNCINSLRLQTIYNEISIIVVDDNSTDGTSEWLTNECSDVKVLRGTGQLFWGGAVHYGIEYILKKGNLGDYILLVNNDVELEYNTLELLKNHVILNERRVITSALTVNQFDRSTIIKSGTVVKNWFLNITNHLFVGEKLESIRLEQARVADFLTARCLLHPIEVFWQAGNYDAESFIHYGGDDEFSMRVKKYGIKTYLLPSAIVFLKDTPADKKNIFKTLFGLRSSSNLINKFKLSLKVAPYGTKLCFFMIGVLKSIIIAIKNAFK
jgi:N-acetylglucosaminyl-diphospho-decaprenol L-rhamnosyltransferase